MLAGVKSMSIQHNKHVFLHFEKDADESTIFVQEHLAHSKFFPQYQLKTSRKILFKGLATKLLINNDQ